VYRFVLRDNEMNDLGSVTLATAAWRLGDIIMTGDGRKFRICDMSTSPSKKPSSCGSTALGGRASRMSVAARRYPLTDGWSPRVAALARRPHSWSALPAAPNPPSQRSSPAPKR
jgi:hypothetical protein